MGLGPGGERKEPTAAEIETLKAQIGMKFVSIDSGNKTLTKQRADIAMICRQSPRDMASMRLPEPSTGSRLPIISLKWVAS